MRKSTLVSAFSISMKRAAPMAGKRNNKNKIHVAPKLIFIEAWMRAGLIDLSRVGQDVFFTIYSP